LGCYSAEGAQGRAVYPLKGTFIVEMEFWWCSWRCRSCSKTVFVQCRVSSDSRCFSLFFCTPCAWQEGYSANFQGLAKIPAESRILDLPAPKRMH